MGKHRLVILGILGLLGIACNERTKISPEPTPEPAVEVVHTESAREDQTFAYQGEIDGSSRFSIIGEVTFSPDGRLLAAISMTGEIILWDFLEQSKLTSFQATNPSSFVWSRFLSLSRDGNYIANIYDNKHIAIWKVPSGSQFRMLSLGSSELSSLSFSQTDDYLAAGSKDGSVRLWRFLQSEHSTSLDGHSAPVTSIKFSSDGKYLASGSSNQIKLSVIPSGHELVTLQGDDSYLVTLALSSDGRYLAATGQTMKVWDLSTRKIHQEIHDIYHALSLAFSPDGRFLAIGEGEIATKVWDIHEGELAKNLVEPSITPVGNIESGLFQGKPYVVRSVAFSPDGLYLACAGGLDPDKMPTHRFAPDEGFRGHIWLWSVGRSRAHAWGKRLWSEGDTKESLELLESLPYDTNEVSMLKVIYESSPFYQGVPPLRFTADALHVGYPIFMNIPIRIHFEDWYTNYIYRSAYSALYTIPDGAVSVEFGSQRVLAEARIVNKGKDIEIEEYHYGRDGEVIFRCESSIELRSGIKIDERVIEGKKEREFFFFYPTSTL